MYLTVLHANENTNQRRGSLRAGCTCSRLSTGPPSLPGRDATGPGPERSSWTPWGAHAQASRPGVASSGCLPIWPSEPLTPRSGSGEPQESKKQLGGHSPGLGTNPRIRSPRRLTLVTCSSSRSSSSSSSTLREKQNTDLGLRSTETHCTEPSATCRLAS